MNKAAKHKGPCPYCPYLDEIPPAPAKVIEDLQQKIEQLEAALPDEDYQAVKQKAWELQEELNAEIKISNERWDRIEQLKAEHEKWDAIASRENEKLQARLDYIGNPQNGSVDLAAYARGDND